MFWFCIQLNHAPFYCYIRSVYSPGTDDMDTCPMLLGYPDEPMTVINEDPSSTKAPRVLRTEQD